MMEIEIRGTLQPEDLLAAQLVHFRPGTTGRVILAVLISGYLWALWLSFSPVLRSSVPWFRWLTVGGAVYFVFLNALLLLVLLPKRVRRTYQQRKELQREFTHVISERGVSSINANGHADKPWGEFLKWKEGKQCFLLYYSDNMFQLFPKRLFASSEQVTSFREMLSAKVEQK